jgi:pSer/pThr/pTyr-binding forkhead associated (FHA) protein
VVGLTADVVQVGRDAANDVVIADTKCSRRHAVLERRGSQVIVRDLGSRNGTWARGERVSGARLADGEVFVIGRTRITIRLNLDRSVGDSP